MERCEHIYCPARQQRERIRQRTGKEHVSPDAEVLRLPPIFIKIPVADNHCPGLRMCSVYRRRGANEMPESLDVILSSHTHDPHRMRGKK